MASLEEPNDGMLELDFSPVPDTAYDGVRTAEANAEAGWWEHGMRTIGEFALTGREFVPDDVTDVIGAPDHVNRVGALFAAASKAGLIEAVGMRRSTRPSRHGNRVCVWRGTEAAAA